MAAPSRVPNPRRERDASAVRATRCFVPACQASSFCTLQGAADLPEDELHRGGESRHLGACFPRCLGGHSHKTESTDIFSRFN